MTKTLSCTIILALASSLALAQTPDSATLPDAPSTVSSRRNTTKPSESRIVHLLSGRSILFPDIAASKHPLTTSEKFELFAASSSSPSMFGGAILGAGLGQAIDSPEGYGQGGEGYAKRLGAAMATGASYNFFGKFLIPSVLHHDPRFFVEGDGSLRDSTKFALRRLFITRTDAGGEAPNFAGLLAPLAAQSIANSYLPENERTVEKTFARSGRSLAVTLGVNVLKEYWPTILKRFKGDKTQSHPAQLP